MPGVSKLLTRAGGLIVAAQYGKGFMTCRTGSARSWSAPANVRVEGGSVGLQAGAGEVDMFLLVMNEAGAKELLKSEFKLGGEVSVMAGPVGPFQPSLHRRFHARQDARLVSLPRHFCRHRFARLHLARGHG